MRDSQRGRVWNALYSFRAVRGTERLEEVEEIQQWVNKITEYAWFRRRWGVRRIGVQPGKRSYAYGYRSTISVPRHSRNKAMILVSMAYVLAPPNAALRSDWHGWLFCHTLRQLVRHTLGKDAEKTLVEAFKKYRVRYKQPRRATTTSGNTEALLRSDPQRLAEWRYKQMVINDLLESL